MWILSCIRSCFPSIGLCFISILRNAIARHRIQCCRTTIAYIVVLLRSALWQPALTRTWLCFTGMYQQFRWSLLSIGHSLILYSTEMMSLCHPAMFSCAFVTYITVLLKYCALLCYIVQRRYTTKSMFNTVLIFFSVTLEKMLKACVIIIIFWLTCRRGI